MRNESSARHRRGSHALVLLAGCCLGTPSICTADETGETGAEDFNFRLELATLGLHNWAAIGRLRPAASGDFEQAGASTGASIHWNVRPWARGTLLFGLDAAVLGNDTSIHHAREDLLVRGFQLTPSVKLVFDDGDGPRYSLDAGVGYYEFDISEVGTFWFGEDAETALWRSSTFGGYLGMTAEFASTKTRRSMGFFVSGKVHYVGLGKVADEGPGASAFGTLGPDAGTLSGPLVMFQIGFHLRR